MKDNISAFFEGYHNRKINDNFEVLRNYAEEIKNNCRELSIAPVKYSMLRPLSKEEDIGSWVALGEYFIGRVGSIENNKVMLDLSENYLKMASTVGHRGFESTAKNLAELVIENYKEN